MCARGRRRSWTVRAEHLAPGETLAIAWGGTIAAAAPNVRRRQDAGNTVISLVGGLTAGGPINPYDNAAMMARTLGATCRYVTAPMIADGKGLRDALLRSAPVADVFASIANAEWPCSAHQLRADASTSQKSDGGELLLGNGLESVRRRQLGSFALFLLVLGWTDASR